MQVVHWGRARAFYRKHPPAESPLKQWRQAVQKADWKNFDDIRNTFASADWLEGNIIFNIKGNHYRLIAIGSFTNQKLYIRQVLTHEEYDENKWKK